jgi:hypothetical protein
MSMLLIDLQRRRQKALYYVGICTEVEQHAAGNDTLDHGQHLCGILADHGA